MARLALVVLAALAAAGCQSDFQNAETESASYDAVEAPAPGAVGGGARQEEAGADASATPTLPAAQAVSPRADSTRGRRLIRTAELGLRVGDYDEARAEIGGLARRFGAYVGGEQETRSETQVTNRLTLRVPAERFEPLLAALVEAGEAVEYRNVQAEDVTERYADLEARLRARRAVEAQYVAILARATTIEEILAVETRLAAVREEIEVAEGQLRYLADRVALSTITVTLTEYSATGLASGPSFFYRLGEAASAGWDGLLGLVLGVVGLWPIWLLGAAAWFALRPVLRRRRQRRTPPVIPAPAPAA